MNTRLARYCRPPMAALIVALAALLIGCGTPFSDPEYDARSPTVITVSGPHFTLSWVEEDPDVVAYRVYRRQRGATQWVVIDANVREQRLMVTKDDLPYGTYEFAVSSINSEGEESALHHSVDNTANPSPWVLRWISE